MDIPLLLFCIGMAYALMLLGYLLGKRNSNTKAGTPSASHNNATDKICANTPCSYCELEPMCKSKVNHQPCFEGRKLSPVA